MASLCDIIVAGALAIFFALWLAIDSWFEFQDRKRI